MIPEPDLYGAYNRYIYVLNNPLKYHDPSGHFWNFIAGAVISFIASQSSNSTLRLIGSVAGMYLMGPASMSSGFTIGNAFTHSFAVGFVNSGIQTGSLQGAFVGGTSALVTAGIGHGNAGNSITSGLTGSQAGDAMLKALLHGIAQGTMASLRGGDFKAGLSSGFVGSVMGHYTGGLSSLSEHESAQFAITVTMGGLTSRAIGGSFNDGVISSATVFLFNDLAGRNARNGRKELGSETSPNLSQGKYPVKITAVSAQFGAGIEVGDIFLADLANDRIVHYGYFSFPMGFESSADVSLLSGFANITSAGGLDGFSVSFDTEMLIGGGVSATYSYSPTSSVVAAGGGVGFSLGKSITLGRTWFKKSYSSHEFQRAFPLVKGF